MEKVVRFRNGVCAFNVGHNLRGELKDLRVFLTGTAGFRECVVEMGSDFVGNSCISLRAESPGAGPGARRRAQTLVYPGVTVMAFAPAFILSAFTTRRDIYFKNALDSSDPLLGPAQTLARAHMLSMNLRKVMRAMYVERHGF